MSATKKLRRLLDERGVKWRMTPHYFSEPDDNETIFDGNGLEWYAREFSNDHVELRTARLIVTPEQAVEATVGRGTCMLPKTPDTCTIERYGNAERYGVAELCKCSACGAKVLAIPAHYCPNCGRRVVE